MKWFKHYSDASSGETLQKVFKKFGLEGEARYWRLVELLAYRFNGKDARFEFSLETIRQSLRHRSLNDCRLFLDHLATISGLIVEYSGNDCTIHYDKILEIKDNHHKNLQASGNKVTPRIDKNRIDKNTYVLKGMTPDEILDLWNRDYGAKFGYCPGLGSGKHLENILESMKFLKTLDEWSELFKKATSSDFLSGNGSSDWTVNFLWLIDYDNALKVLSDVYNDQKAINAIRLDFINKVQK